MPEKISSFSLTVLITIFITRIVISGLFYLLESGSVLAQRIVTDSWHHYHVGILLMLIGFLQRKSRKFGVLLAVGLGIFLEEWAVFLNDLGLNTRYLYYTTTDFISVCTLVVLVYFFSKKLDSN